MTQQHSQDRKKLSKKPTICQCYLSVSAKLFSLFSTCAFHSIFFICARKTKSRTPVTMPTHCAVGALLPTVILSPWKNPRVQYWSSFNYINMLCRGEAQTLLFSVRSPFVSLRNKWTQLLIQIFLTAAFCFHR